MTFYLEMKHKFRELFQSDKFGSAPHHLAVTIAVTDRRTQHWIMFYQEMKRMFQVLLLSDALVVMDASHSRFALMIVLFDHYHQE